MCLPRDLPLAIEKRVFPSFLESACEVVYGSFCFTLFHLATGLNGHTGNTQKKTQIENNQKPEPYAWWLRASWQPKEKGRREHNIHCYVQRRKASCFFTLSVLATLRGPVPPRPLSPFPLASQTPGTPAHQPCARLRGGTWEEPL